MQINTKISILGLMMLLISFTACDSGIDDPPAANPQVAILQGSTWSLYSTQQKRYVKGSTNILSDVTTLGNCSLKSRLEFKNGGVAIYNDNCNISQQITGTWGFSEDGKLVATLDLILSSGTGFDKISFGFPASEILSLDKNEFKLRRFDNSSITEGNVKTDYVTETIITYSKAN